MYTFAFRSTPIETLHTILLGPYKYLLRKLMSKLTVQQKNGVRARIASFPSSGLQYEVTSDICRYTGSLVGRDFKSIAQMGPFILMPHVDEKEKPVWLALSKVNVLKLLMILLYILMLKIFKITYCKPFKLSDLPQYEELCASFVSAVKLGVHNCSTNPRFTYCSTYLEV